jgi:hypothetical protein
MVSIHRVDSRRSRGPSASNKCVETETRSRFQCGPHRRLVCVLIALEHRLRIFPTCQIAEVSKRRVLQLRRELAAQAVPASPGCGRQFGDLFRPLPAVMEEMPRRFVGHSL